MWPKSWSDGESSGMDSQKDVTCRVFWRSLGDQWKCLQCADIEASFWDEKEAPAIGVESPVAG